MAPRTTILLFGAVGTDRIGAPRARLRAAYRRADPYGLGV